MVAQLVRESQQFSGACNAVINADMGVWQLAAGRALTLQPTEAAELVVSQGRIWATLDGPHSGAEKEAGDRVLRAGQRLALRAGQRLVIESWDPVTRGPASFEWHTRPTALPLGVHSGSHWQVAVAQPLRELRSGLWQVVQAFGRLLWGVAGLTEYLAAGRGRVMPHLQSNQP